MASCVLTLIGNADTEPLETTHVERVCRQLSIIGDVDWLGQNEACDLFIESSLTTTEIAAQARDVLAGGAFDAVCMPVRGRRKKLVISDMDSTIIDQECIDELGEFMGIGPRIKEITAAVINGDLSFAQALRRRLALIKGMDRKLLEQVFEDRISLKTGARIFIQTMRRHGAYCILVSGGFSFFTRRVAKQVGFDDHEGNELIFENDKLTGYAVEPILGRTAKLTTLSRHCREKGLEMADVLAVGDGANDIKMIEAAGLGVALHGAPRVRDHANACIDHGDLTALLYIQGFHKSEFILT